jgi:hypothetical protein
MLDAYQGWRDNLPAGIADSAIADRLDAVLSSLSHPVARAKAAA